MVTEKELISKLQELRQIKPNQDWAFSLKERILAQEPRYGYRSSITFFPFFKPVFATVLSVFVLTGIFGFAQNSVPGDFLYSVKKITEKGQALFVSEEEKLEYNISLANKRLEELTRIAESNRVKNLPSAISETQNSISEVSRSLASTSGSEEIGRISSELEEKIQRIESYGVAGLEGVREELKQGEAKIFVESLISDLETRSLTEAQQEVFSQMKELAEGEQYEEAIILFNAEFDKPAVEEEEVDEEAEEEEEEEIEE